MSIEDIKSAVVALSIEQLGCEVTGIEQLPKSGSSRQYFRISLTNSTTVVGTYSSNIPENRAFIYLAKHFYALGLNVPKIIAISAGEEIYLQTDLGQVSLFDVITGQSGPTSSNVQNLVQQALQELVKFHVIGVNGLDSSKLYPIPNFDRRSILWDLNYFKYCFLKLLKLDIDEVALDDDFDRLSNRILDGGIIGFQYRDFQSRNIMIQNNSLYFIDFQGGRLGPCLYDVASLLYQAKANFSDDFRMKMVSFYLAELSKYQNVDATKMIDDFKVIAVFRIIQTLGAYGYRGLFEQKPHFVHSISAALINLKMLLLQISPSIIPYIEKVVNSIDVADFETQPVSNCSGLTVRVSSISLKKGYPKIDAEHGGGFVFDCRSLPNPGRIERFKTMNGLDAEVAEYLNSCVEVDDFMAHAESLVLNAVSNYRKRQFNFLSVAFGCTGGQHRSVFCANRLALRLKKIEGVNLVVEHTELKNISRM